MPPPMAERPVILIVDDDPRNRALVRATLGGAHDVVESASGAEALRVVDGRPVDLVLLDVMMPGMSGFETCKAIKARPREGFLPVVLLTALSEQGDRNAGLDAGADDFLTKPVDRLELRLRVALFLRLRAQDAQIRAQLRRVRELDALKDDLASLLVHDLRSPLAGVLSILQVIRGELRDPQLLADADAALDAAGKVRALVDDVLQVRALEEGKLPLELAPRRLDELVRDAVRTLEPVARERRVAIDTAGAAPLEARVDATLVRRAVENFVTNAVRYSSAGGTVAVNVLREGAGVSIEVKDEGPGVPEPLRDAVFEKFVTVEGAGRLPRRGSGLGLHLVKLVAAAHGGRVRSGGREGGGSVFALWLPLAGEA